MIKLEVPMELFRVIYHAELYINRNLNRTQFVTQCMNKDCSKRFAQSSFYSIVRII